MKRILLFLALTNAIVSVLYAQTPDANGIIYVKKGAAGDGSSWVNAYPELGDAMYVAGTLTAGTVKQIWVAGGTYHPQQSIDGSTTEKQRSFTLVKDVQVYGGFAGTETTLSDRDLTLTANASVLSGDYNENTTASDNVYHVVFGIGDLGTAILDGFTITGGYATGGLPAYVNGTQIYNYTGGGITLYSNASVALSNLIITDNYGEGIYALNNSFTLTNSVVKNNVGINLGGGIFVSGTNIHPVFDHVKIMGNSNFSAGGGGLAIQGSGKATFTNCTISGNTAASAGGGLYAFLPFEMTNVLITGNSAGLAGGIYVISSGGSLTNVTVSANYCSGSYPAIRNIYPTNLSNCLIYGNRTSGGDSTGIVENYYTGSYNLIQGVEADAANHNLDGNTNPLFTNMPVATNTATTAGDYTLQPASPALNAGSNALNTTTTDIAGNSRAYGIIDLGAYEMQLNLASPDANGILYVKKGNTGSGSSWNDPMGEVADALNGADSLNKITAGKVKQIWVAGGIYYPVYVPDGATTNIRDQAFSLVKDVQVYGGFAGTESVVSARDITQYETVLSGDLGTTGTTTDNARHVVISAGDMGTAVLDGFTVSGGHADGSGSVTIHSLNISKQSGGGIYVANGTPGLSNLTLKDNYAAYNGGGGVASNSRVILSNVAVLNNSAGFLGGGFSLQDNSSAVMSNIDISGNTAGVGGGIYEDYSDSLIIINGKINGNKTTTSAGGGIGANAQKIVLRNVQITGNVVTGTPGLGSGLLTYGGELTNVTIASNYGGSAIYSVIPPVISNSVVYGNVGGDGLLPMEYTGSNNLIQGVPADAATHTLDGSTDPLFNNMPVPAGYTFTYGDFSLQPVSPLLDAGDNTLYPSLDADSKDLNNNARVTYYSSGGIIDIGANEFPIQYIKAKDTTKTYGDADFDYGAIATSGLQVNYAIADSTVASVREGLIHIKKAGTVSITISQPGDVGNSSAPDRVVTLTIGKGALTVRAKDSTMVYTGTGFSGGNGVVLEGLAYQDDATDVGGTLSYSGSSQGAVNVGKYVIDVSGLTSDNYVITYVADTLRIVGATLTVTAAADSKVYDAMTYSGGHGVTYTGFVNGESVSDLGGTLNYSGSSQGAINTGNYDITPNGLTADNYVFKYVSGALTISQAGLTITAVNDTVNYSGNAYSGGNGVTYTGFVTGDTESVLMGTLIYTGTSQGANRAGSFVITPSGLSATNYTITFANGSLFIQPDTITVTAQDDSKIYDGTAYATGNGITYAGFVNSEDESIFNGAPAYSGSSQGAINTGNYDITPNGLTADNYVFKYVPGTLTISQAALTITALNDTVNYSGNAYANGNGIVYNGFVNGEGASDLTGGLSYTGSSQGAINAGSYLITPTGLTSNNYAISYIDGNLIIAKDTLHIIAANDERNYTGTAYTGGNGVTYTGFVNGESESVLTGTLDYSGNSQHAVNAGTYTLTPTGISADNYIIVPVAGSLVIAPATLIITANDASRCYGGADPAFTVSYSGFVNNESAGVFTTQATVTSAATAQSSAGSYPLTPAGATALNYTISYVNGILTVTPAAVVTVSAPDGIILCGNTTIQLQADGSTTYTWKKDNIVIDNIADNVLQVSAAGTYTVSGSDANGCPAVSPNSITITAVQAPAVSFTYNTYCAGLPVVFTSNSSNGVNYTWNSGDGQNSTDASPSFTYQTAGNFTATVTVSAIECPTLTATASQVITIETPVAGKTLPGINITPSVTTAISGRDLNGATYQWTPANGLSQDDIYNPSVTLTSSQTYHIQMNFASGCATIDTLNVVTTSRAAFAVANAFTPNGDGINDVLHIAGRGVSAFTYFNIYDRTSNQVYHSNDVAAGWDGTSKGKPMPMGTYIWMAVGLDYQGNLVKTQGTVTLIR